MSSQTGVILQARLGSTRLPGKMLMPFYKDVSLLEILLKRLTKNITDIKIIVATSNNEKDNALETLCEKLNIHCFRGSENNVLDRFIGASEHFNLQQVVRICADNPFLLPEYIIKLIENFKPELDYLSYAFDDGTPVIKSHIGLFAEMTTLKTLKNVRSLTSESIYLEHVTNYIYSNPNLFKVKFLPVDKILKSRQDIRLTVDTLEDFKLTQNLYKEIKNKSLTLENIIKYIDGNEAYKTIMLSEIKNNSK